MQVVLEVVILIATTFCFGAIPSNATSIPFDRTIPIAPSNTTAVAQWQPTQECDDSLLSTRSDKPLVVTSTHIVFVTSTWFSNTTITICPTIMSTMTGSHNQTVTQQISSMITTSVIRSVTAAGVTTTVPLSIPITITATVPPTAVDTTSPSVSPTSQDTSTLQEYNYLTNVHVCFHTDPDCSGECNAKEFAYWIPIAYQALSYSLDKDLDPEARMDYLIFDPEDRPTEPVGNQDMPACTSKVQEADKERRRKGCFNFAREPVGCLQVYLPGPVVTTGEPGLQPDKTA